MAKVTFGPIVSEARNKHGNLVFARGPYGAYTRAYSAPDETPTAPRQAVWDRMAAAAYAWNNSLSANQRAAWEAFSRSLAYTDVYGADKIHAGRTVFLEQFLYLDNLGLATLTDPPASTDRRSLATASLTFTFPTNTLSLNLTWPAGQPQPPVIVHATPPLNPAVNVPGHRFKQIAALSSVVGYPYNLWSAYYGVHGLPLPGKQIFIEARPVHPTTGLAGGKLMAHSTDPGVVDGCRIYHSANQTIPDTAFTPLTFDSQRYDNGGMHNPAANPTRITAQKAGKYAVWGHIALAANATGMRILYIRLNGTTFLACTGLPVLAAVVLSISLSTAYHLAAGDYIEVVVYQTSGGNLDVLALPNYSPEFAAQWTGA